MLKDKSYIKVMIIMIVCLLCMHCGCIAEEYDLSDPDELDYGIKKDVVFMNENVVYIDGGFYLYKAYVGLHDWVVLSSERNLYEWNGVEMRDLCYTAVNPNPEIPVCVRTADGETFESLTAAMHHIMGYLVRHETMPILVDLDIEW